MKNAHTQIWKLSVWYIILSDVIYQKSYNGLIVRCLTKVEIPLTLQESHLGFGGGHFGCKFLVHKLIHIRYFWKIMEQDSFAFVKKCLQCQKNSNLIRAPAQEVQNQTSPWPFTKWGLDIIDKISPPSSKGHIFMITTTDYFMKWVKIIPIWSTNTEAICSFLLNNIIDHFGLPSTLVSDNGNPFKNKEVKQLLERFHI